MKWIQTTSRSSVVGNPSGEAGGQRGANALRGTTPMAKGVGLGGVAARDATGLVGHS